MQREAPISNTLECYSQLNADDATRRKRPRSLTVNAIIAVSLGACSASPATDQGSLHVGAEEYEISDACGTELRQAAADVANRYAGHCINPTNEPATHEPHSCKYTWGGTSNITGMDCSGFTSFVYRPFRIADADPARDTNLVHDAGGQYSEAYGRVMPRDGRSLDDVLGELTPGDVLFFAAQKSKRSITHTAIYVGGGTIAHAVSPRYDITKNLFAGDPTSSDYYWEHYIGAMRPTRGFDAGKCIAKEASSEPKKCPCLPPETHQSNVCYYPAEQQESCPGWGAAGTNDGFCRNAPMTDADWVRGAEAYAQVCNGQWTSE